MAVQFTLVSIESTEGNVTVKFKGKTGEDDAITVTEPSAETVDTVLEQITAITNAKTARRQAARALRDALRVKMAELAVVTP